MYRHIVLSAACSTTREGSKVSRNGHFKQSESVSLASIASSRILASFCSGCSNDMPTDSQHCAGDLSCDTPYAAPPGHCRG